MSKILLCKEVDRDVIYYTYSEKVYRVPRQELPSILKKLGITNYEDAVKKGIIREVLTDDYELQGLREQFIQEQLNGDFLENLSSPFDDDSVCEDLFEQALDRLSKEKIKIGISFRTINIRSLRTKKDSKNITVNGDNINQVEVRLFNLLLSKYQDLEPVEELLNNLSTEARKYLLEHIDNLELLGSIFQAILNNNLSSKIIKYFNTNDINIIKDFHLHMVNLRHEHVGSYNYIFSHPTIDRVKYNTRIYLNCHNERVLAEFLELYIEECLKHGLNYNMKGIYQSDVSETNDASILYSDVTELKLRIEIIEGILLKHPEWRQYFKHPVYGPDCFGTGFYGICHHPNPLGSMKEGLTTFNDYCQNLMVSTIYYMLSKVLLDNGIIKPSDKLYSVAQALANFDTTRIKILEGSGEIYVDDLKITNSPLNEYLNNPNIILKIKNLGYKVFRDYLYKTHNFCKKFPNGSHMHLALDETMVKYFKNGEINQKVFENIRYSEPEYSLLEKYIKMRKSKSISSPLIFLLEKVDECLMLYHDNLIELKDIIGNLRLITILLDRYLKNRTLNPKFSEDILNFIKNSVDYIVRVTDAKKRISTDSKKEKFKIELKKKIDIFLNIRSKIKIDNLKLNALIQEQYINMLYYYEKPNAIYDEKVLTIIDNCNQKLLNKEFEKYEVECKSLKDYVENSKKMLATISELKPADEKTIKRDATIDKTSSVKGESKKFEPSSKKVPERASSTELESKFTPDDIAKFLDKFRMFRINFNSRVNEKYKKVLQSIFDIERFYYEHQDLINGNIFLAMEFIYNDCLEIEEEYDKNNTILTFKLASLELMAKFLEKTMPKEKNKESEEIESTTMDITQLFIKYSNLRHEISSKLDIKYKNVLQNIFKNECLFYSNKDLIDEQVLKIFDTINIVCSKIAFALANGNDIDAHLSLLEELDKNLETITNKKSDELNPTYETPSGKSF